MAAVPSTAEPTGSVILAGRVVVVVAEGTPLAAGLAQGVMAAGGRIGWISPTPIDAEPLGLSDQVLVVQAELTERQSMFKALDRVASHFGGVDGLVFAWIPAAAATEVRMAEMNDAHFDLVWEQPMQAAIFSFQAAYGHFKQQGNGGRLVAVAPTIAMSGGAGYSASAASAEGLRLLVKSAARQWGEDGVTANTIAVAPGQVIPDAPNFECSLAERALGRLGDPRADLGPVVAFLTSEGGGFVTGPTLFVDGGLWMSAA